MSAYAVDTVCWRILHDREFRETVRSDPADALEEFDLSPEERAALIGGEVGRLFELGAHPFLLRYLAIYGVAGLDVERYSERMRAAAAADVGMRPGY
jgi:hypothetical protein